MRLPMKNLNSGSKPIDTVLFDFDGTLTDFIQLVDILQISYPTAEFQNVLINGVDHISETVVAY